VVSTLSSPLSDSSNGAIEDSDNGEDNVETTIPEETSGEDDQVNEGDNSGTQSAGDETDEEAPKNTHDGRPNYDGPNGLLTVGRCDAACMESLVEQVKLNFVDADGNVQVTGVDELSPIPEMMDASNNYWYWFYTAAFEQATGESFDSLSGYQQATVLIVLGYTN